MKKEESLIRITCKCGKHLDIKGKGWQIDAPKGNDWTFTCPCGWKIVLPKDTIKETKE